MYQAKYLIMRINEKLAPLLKKIRIKRATGKTIASIMLPLLMVGYGVVGWVIMKKIISPIPAKEYQTSMKANNAKDEASISQEIPMQLNPAEQEQIISYSPSDIKSWEDILANQRKIQPSWQKWDKGSNFYKDNKVDIQRINTIISQRISNSQKILVTMKSNQPLSTEAQKMINVDSPLYNELESLTKKINGKLDAPIKDSSSSSKSHSDDPVVANTPVILPPPYVKSTSPSNTSTPIDTEAIRKQQEASCESNYTSCVNSGISAQEKIMRGAGTGNSSEAQLVASRVMNSCKIQYRCEVYP